MFISKVNRKLKQFINIIRERRLKLFLQGLPSEILRRRLKKIYEKRSMQKTVKIEPPTAEIISLGKQLREDVLEQYKDKYSSKEYRFLFQLPPGGLGAVWFADLMQTLEHAGIACLSVQWNDPNFKLTWETFHPNVFITLDLPVVLNSLDLDYINEYKSRSGCLRLFTPVNKYNYPYKEMNSEDQWRFDLACAGRSADAFFCMFVEEYFAQVWTEWKDFGFQYLSLPHGCNPIYQYPREASKDLDYFMATTFGPERVTLTWQYLKTVFRKYKGLWAGPGWEFGMGFVNSQQLPDLYARSKIIPNPLARFLIEYPSEITERAYSATACGAFQITDWTPVTERFFTSDELITVRSKREFLEKFDNYLVNSEMRNQTIIKGMKRVFSEHTYFHRIDKLIAFLDNNQELFYSSPKNKSAFDR